MDTKLVLSALIMMFSSEPAPEAYKGYNIQVSEYGIYAVGVEAVGKNVAEKSEDDFPDKDVELRVKTASVPARAGITFGFLFSVTGGPAGSVVPLRLVTVFSPKNREKNSDETNGIREERIVNVEKERAKWIAVTLDDDRKLRPGDWTFEIWNGLLKLHEQSFSVR